MAWQASWRLWMRVHVLLPQRKPQVVGDEVGHRVVEPIQQPKHIVGEEDGVVIAVQHKLVRAAKLLNIVVMSNARQFSTMQQTLCARNGTMAARVSPA